MPLPTVFLAKTDATIRDELVGFTTATVTAVIRLRDSGTRAELRAILPGVIAFHLPSGKPAPREPLGGATRLREDIGLDSLALTEMAFKLEELIGVRIEIREVSNLTTVGELIAFLESKLMLEK